LYEKLNKRNTTRAVKTGLSSGAYVVLFDWEILPISRTINITVKFFWPGLTSFILVAIPSFVMLVGKKRLRYAQINKKSVYCYTSRRPQKVNKNQ